MGRTGRQRPLSRNAEEFLTWLAVDQGRARNTLVSYRRDLVSFEGFLGERGATLSDADLRTIEEYLARRRAGGLGPASVARALAAIRGLYRFCVEEGWADSDPTADVSPPRLPVGLPKAIDEAKVALLLDFGSADDPVTRRDRAILELLYGTGMRVSELVGLSLTEVHFDSGLVQVLGKGDKERLVPLGRYAADALERWLAPAGRGELVPVRWARRGDAEAVFLNARGGRLTRQGAWRIVEHRARRVGLPDPVHPHVMRHSCATHMLAHGADIRVVQELLGHASIATTQRYTKVSLEHLREAYEQAHPRAQRQRAQ